MDKLTGKLLSERYEIQEKIGCGGMANVYKAHCRTLNRTVAIKILKDEFRNNEEFVKRFKTESQAVALLSHPNIVAVYDVGAYDGLPFIVMEYIDGITLKDYMDKKGVLSTKEIIIFVRQILLALRHAHGRKIIHRDIKPQNIMMLRNGTVKIADFGIARFVMSNTQTITESAIGSAHYLSPEQAKGSVTDEKTDIYSVGVIIYEMLTGKVPFDAENPVMVAIMHIQGNAKPPHLINPNAPSALESIAMHAMAREPFNRYSNAEEMLSDIIAFGKNPNIVFNYKYNYNPAQNTQYFDAVKHYKNVENVNDKYNSRYRTDENEENPKTNHNKEAANKRLRKKAIMTVLSLIVLVSVLVLGGKAFINILEFGTIWPGEREELVVPDFTDMTVSEIEEDEKYKDFKIIVTDKMYDTEIEKDKVISQDPKAGSKVRPDKEINVTLSLGIDRIEVPDIINMEYRQAVIALKDKGFIPTVEYIFDDNIINGYVVKCNPDVGTKHGNNTAITLYVSKGKEQKMVTVPSVLGKTEDVAKAMMTDAGLVVKKVEPVASEQKRGIIISQSIAAGQSVSEKTEIILEISAGVKSKQDIYIPFKEEPQQFELKILVNGTEIYKATHYAAEGGKNITIEGYGSTLVEAYIDGVLYISRVVTFE